MIGGGGQRWAISLADLLALLLGFFVLASADARTRDRAMGGVATALGQPVAPAPSRRLDATRFVPGEARLTPAGGAEVDAVASAWRARPGAIRVSATGRPPGTNRFDGWELSAARAAFVARRMRSSGIAEGRIAVTVDTAAAGAPQVEIARTR